MPDLLDLKIFHYHFMTGGVSTVVRQAVEALRAHLPEVRSVELVAGADGIPSPMQRSSVKRTVIPELGYRRPDVVDSGSVAREAAVLAERLLRSFGSEDSVWWIHNHHLGKNVVFTQAILEIARSGRQRMILQIHDFPECGRFRNLALLRRSLSLDPYPVGSWVRYAVLNRRDRDILIRSGLPGEAVFLLENPVFQEPEPARPRRTGPRRTGPRRTRQRSAARTLKPLLGNSAPVLLYPVRAIRRKNALEAVLLCMLLDTEVNLLITLPGLSDAERPFSELVRKIFSDRLCPGLFGIGAELDSHGLHLRDLVEGSDLVLSSSVQEGFGYLFVNALLWSLPLAARNLDTLADMRELFTGYPACFYEAVRVPLTDSAALLQAYRSKILGLSELIGEEERDRLLEAMGALAEGGRVDFSYLPVGWQHNLIREIAAGRTGSGDAGGVLSACREHNRLVLSGIRDLLASGVNPGSREFENKEAEVRQRFGAAAYAAAFRRILESFGETGSPTAAEAGTGAAASTPGEVGRAVLKEFLRLENLRLLYDY
jgi:hypothetical protein